jgi:hypothetical protein
MNSEELTKLEGILRETPYERVHRAIAAFRYLDLDLLGLQSLGIDNITVLNKDTVAKSAFKRVMGEKEEEYSAELKELYADMQAAIFGELALHHIERRPITINNHLDRVQLLLDPEYLSEKNRVTFWGRPDRVTVRTMKPQVIPNDVATTVHWLTEFLKGKGDFDTSELTDTYVDIQGDHYPQAYRDSFSRITTGRMPFMTTYRVKMRSSCIEKALRKMFRRVYETREQARAIESATPISVLLESAVDSPILVRKAANQIVKQNEKHWLEGVRREVADGFELNDIGGITAFYLGGHTPGVRDGITSAIELLRTDSNLTEKYDITIKNMYTDPQQRLHRIKVSVQKKNSSMKHELILVGLVEHVAQYEFGPYSYIAYARERDKQKEEPGSHETIAFGEAQAKELKYFRTEFKI